LSNAGFRSGPDPQRELWPAVEIEAVAAKRRALPLGGEVPEDYVFERIGKTSMPENVKMSVALRLWRQ
jgi:predicted dithiol-disulfide oxidoreductase (DUF899 family)